MQKTVVSHYTVIIKPIPRGIGRDDLVAHHLGKYGQIKDIRFGNGKGVAGDVMFVDYFDHTSAIAAASSMNGTKDPGTSLLRLSVVLSPMTLEAIRKIQAQSQTIPEPKRFKLTEEPKPMLNRAIVSKEPNGSFKLLKSKACDEEICVIDVLALVNY